MTKKVTISVPEELYEKMAKWRSSLNFSKIFQKAIAGMIQSKEEFQKKIKTDLDISDIIERLKKEKLETEINYRENGKKDALEWFKTAHYCDILYALKWVPNDEPTKDEKLGDYFTHLFSKNRVLSFATPYNKNFNMDDSLQKYIAGWKEGVQEFWNEIKDKIRVT